MKDQLKRILGLVRRTGDTMIVTDPNGEDVFVVMDLDQYEMLLDAVQNEDPLEISEDELEDFPWEEPSALANFAEPSQSTPDIWETMKPAGVEGETWDMSKMSEKELKNLEDQYKTFAAQSVSEAIEETAIATAPTEPIEQPKKEENEEDFGEEQFYLEPIE